MFPTTTRCAWSSTSKVRCFTGCKFLAQSLTEQGVGSPTENCRQPTYAKSDIGAERELPTSRLYDYVCAEPRPEVASCAIPLRSRKFKLDSRWAPKTREACGHADLLCVGSCTRHYILPLLTLSMPRGKTSNWCTNEGC